MATSAEARANYKLIWSMLSSARPAPSQYLAWLIGLAALKYAGTAAKSTLTLVLFDLGFPAVHRLAARIGVFI